MDDSRHPAADPGHAGASCPEFEVLSCFVDGEIDEARLPAVRDHVARCPHCATLAARLREGFDGGDARRDGGIGGSGCAGEERLVLYVSGGLPEAERTTVAGHLAVCDACVRAVEMVHRRLAVSAQVATPVPAGLRRRAMAALEASVREWAPAAPVAARAAGFASAWIRRLGDLLRMPVLVPAAVAAGALLFVALRDPGLAPAPAPVELSRAVPGVQARLRVRTTEAIVRSRPSRQSEVVATVRRGTVLDVAGEERDWYEVVLEGGTRGWVVREAFE